MNSSRAYQACGGGLMEKTPMRHPCHQSTELQYPEDEDGSRNSVKQYRSCMRSVFCFNFDRDK